MNTWRHAVLSGRVAARSLGQAATAPPAPSEDVVRQLCSIAADYADARKRGKDDAAVTWKGMFDMTAESRAPRVDKRALLDDLAAFPECKVPEQYLRELGGGPAPLSGALRPVRVDRAALASLLGAVARRGPGVGGMLDDWNESNKRVRDLLAPGPASPPAPDKKPPERPAPAPAKPPPADGQSPYFGPERDAILEKMCAIAYAYQRERRAGRSGGDAKEAFAKALGSLKAPETYNTYDTIRTLLQSWCPGVDPGYIWELIGPSVRFLQDQEARGRVPTPGGTRLTMEPAAPAFPLTATAYVPPTAGTPPLTPLPPRAPAFRMTPTMVPSGFQPSGPAGPGTPTPPASPQPSQSPAPYQSPPWVETAYAKAPTGTALPGFPFNVFGGAGGGVPAGMFS